MKKKFIILLIIIFLFPGIIFSSISITHLFNGDISLGGYIYKGEPSSLGGILNLTYIPAFKFSDKFSIIPIYYGNYRGTKDVQELAGGGTLFQQQLDNSIILKGIYQLNNNSKIKLKTSGKIANLMETNDETLGKGLFDYNKLSIGTEFEQKFETKLSKILFGIEYFTTNFPNYIALPEKYGLELSTANKSNSGKNVLDFNAISIYITDDLSFKKIYIRNNISYIRKNFIDQNILDKSLQNSQSLFNPNIKRNDDIINFSVLMEKNIKKSEKIGYIIDLNYNFTYSLSNQNHYDVKKTLFIEKYYDYMDNSITPYIGIVFIEKMIKLGLSFEIGLKNYMSRPAQDESDNYLKDKIYINYYTLGLSFSAPIKKRISIKSNINTRINISNMKSETVYAYNFSSFNYFLGLGYEY